MNPEFHRCAYCANCKDGRDGTDVCAEAYRIAHDAGFPLAMHFGFRVMPLDLSSDEAGRFCEAFELASWEEIKKKCGQDDADAAYGEAYDPCADRGVVPGRDFPGSLGRTV